MYITAHITSTAAGARATNLRYSDAPLELKSDMEMGTAVIPR